MSTSNPDKEPESALEPAVQDDFDPIPDELAHSAPTAELVSSYRRLPALIDQINTAFPDSTIQMDKCVSTNAFRGLFVCLGACKRFSEFALKVIALDSIRLRSPAQGTLLLAVQMDANRQYFPIAFAITPKSESDETWRWFLRLFYDSMSNLPTETVFVANREKGSIAALEHVYPTYRRRWCLDHIIKSARNRGLGDDFCTRLRRVCKDRDKEVCDRNFSELQSDFAQRKLGLTGAPYASFLYHLKLDYIADAYLKDIKTYGVRTTNIVEGANDAFKAFRNLLIDELFLAIVNWCGTRFADIRHAIIDMKSPRNLIPFASQYLAAKLDKIESYKLMPGTDWFIVESRHYSLKVFLPRHNEPFSCVCGRLEDRGLPCTHMIAVAKNRGFDYHTFVDDRYLLSNYHIIHNDSTLDNVIAIDLKDLPEDSTVKTPNLRSLCTPSSSMHKLPLGHIPKLATNRPSPSHRRTYRCSLCGAMGHTKNRCKNSAIAPPSTAN